MKRQLKKDQFAFLISELDYWETTDLISSQQKDAIKEQYDIKSGLNFIKVIVTIGAILVGLGVLSFIASNWDGLSKIVKLLIIFGAYGGVNFAGYRLSRHYPKTGKSLIYLGTLVYGAGIFLIGQIFNFGGDFTAAFLLWSLGIVPMAFQQKDKYLMLFANVLFLVYITGTIHEEFPWAALIGIPVLYYAFMHFEQSRQLLFFANLTALVFILNLSITLTLNDLHIAVIFFCIGLLMYFIRHSFHAEVFKLQGNSLFGIAGIALTFPSLWNALLTVHSSQVIASVLFTLVFLGLLFALIRKGSIISLIFVCITIFRFYTDTFALLPKSLFFIVGGILLLGFGFYFERMRKTQGGMHI